jgi:hypothetical protein
VAQPDPLVLFLLHMFPSSPSGLKKIYIPQLSRPLSRMMNTPNAMNTAGIAIRLYFSWFFIENLLKICENL